MFTWFEMHLSSFAIGSLFASSITYYKGYFTSSVTSLHLSLSPSCVHVTHLYHVFCHTTFLCCIFNDTSRSSALCNKSMNYRPNWQIKLAKPFAGFFSQRVFEKKGWTFEPGGREVSLLLANFKFQLVSWGQMIRSLKFRLLMCPLHRADSDRSERLTPSSPLLPLQLRLWSHHPEVQQSPRHPRGPVPSTSFSWLCDTFPNTCVFSGPAHTISFWVHIMLVSVVITALPQRSTLEASCEGIRGHGTMW